MFNIDDQINTTTGITLVLVLLGQVLALLLQHNTIIMSYDLHYFFGVLFWIIFVDLKQFYLAGILYFHRISFKCYFYGYCALFFFISDLFS